MTENKATVATAPAVNIGCATFSGNFDNAAAYNKNAAPYKPKPSQKGQLLNTVRGVAINSAIDGNFLGGTIAIFTNTLAEALDNIPKTKMSHFMKRPLPDDMIE